jgi:uncharacterized membrane protein YphA (DoxX/SURF4 family)
MRWKPIAYWVATMVVALALLPGGVAQLAHQRETVAGIVLLGYPAYFATILGFWKVLGGAALLAPRLPRLKEWAYAGAVFDLTGAAASHAACGDYGAYGFHLAVPLLFAGAAVASWALRPASRRVDALCPQTV